MTTSPLTPLDWFVMAGWLIFLTAYGLYRGRGSNTVNQFLLAGKTMPWYAMGLSIMATQASAITFISTTGQAYVDGMRFVQFYFGLPVAMILIAAFVVPRFHRSGVYTAYEYLERRFDLKTRTLVSVIFLIQRGLGAGISLYAPAVVLSVILGIPDWQTTLIMGTLVIIYTTSGGIKAVTWADVQQMMVISAGLVLAFVVALMNLPEGVGFAGSLAVAGAAGRLNAVVTHFDWNDRYNLFSGLIGGTFLALAYFGTDQSQVQRYLTGKDIAESRISLVFNAIAKIPLQFFILLIGATVFSLFHFSKPPILFQPVEMAKLADAPEYPAMRERYDQAFAARREAAMKVAQQGATAGTKRELAATEAQFQAVRKEALAWATKSSGVSGFSDTNYIFMHYVTTYLPVGLVGLLVGVIFSAAMSAISGEVNSLATVTVIDVCKRLFYPDASDNKMLNISRLATVFWGIFAMGFAQLARSLGSLIEAVNLIGSLFYGGLLGVFVLAFFFQKVGARAAFASVLIGEAAIFYANFYTKISFLWFNVIGCVVVVAAGVLLSFLWPRETHLADAVAAK